MLLHQIKGYSMRSKIISLLFLFLYFLTSCSDSLTSESDPQVLFSSYCSGCHVTPDPSHIPKNIWKENVLPEMAARLGYLYDGYNPKKKNSMEENFHVGLANVYPSQPLIDSLTWKKIHDYVISNAPDKIEVDSFRNKRNSNITQFSPKPISIDTRDLAGITNVQFDKTKNKFIVGNVYGETTYWPNSKDEFRIFGSSMISYQKGNDAEYFTEVGYLNPSEIPSGAIYKKQNGQLKILAKDLHRPVFSQVEDLNNDNIDEVLICEFGNHTGELSMIIQSDKIEKKNILPLPGIIKTEIIDINKDGKKDIVVLASQGREGIYILYQENNLNFRLEQVIQMGSEYGSSWFELVDYNGDNHLDIVLVNGDNADYSIFPKPYHGVRIFINDGENQFEEKWFYPIYGATRVLANDYDLDGDIDLAVMAFFPSFDSVPEENFVYLENKNGEDFTFESSTFSEQLTGRLLVMDDGDFDQDGDVDIMLGSFVLIPGSSQEEMIAQSGKEKVDLFLLENKGK